MFVARHIVEGTAGKLPSVTYDDSRKIEIVDQTHIRSKYYLRFSTHDRTGVLSKIFGILSEHGVSIDSVFQPPVRDGDQDDSGARILIVTHEAVEDNVIKVINHIDKLKMVKSKTVMIRIEG